MKNICFILIFLSTFLQSQNLVPNWSFETYTACPTSGNEVPSPWTMPTSNSTDYFNSCAPPGSFSVPYNGSGGFQYAQNGVAYEGAFLLNAFGSNYREYMQVQLTNTLTAGDCYYVEFFTNLWNESRFATRNVAANFSSIAYPTTYTSVSTATTLNVPQHITRYGNPIIKDTLNWVNVAGIYTSVGGEKYITLGSFKNDSGSDTAVVNTTMSAYYGAYYFFDAVSVYSINPTGTLPWTYSNTSVAIGDSVYIGNYLGGGFTSNWCTLPGVFIKTGAGIYVKPVTTSTYVVQFTVCGVPRSDTLTVTVTGTGINEFGIENSQFVISPNPNNGVFNIEILDKQFILQESELKIVTVLGQEIKKEKLLSKKQQLDISELSSGMYYVQIVNKGKIVVVKKILKQ